MSEPARARRRPLAAARPRSSRRLERGADGGGGALARLHRAVDARVDALVGRLAREPHRVAGRLGEARPGVQSGAWPFTSPWWPLAAASRGMLERVPE